MTKIHLERIKHKTYKYRLLSSYSLPIKIYPDSNIDDRHFVKLDEFGKLTLAKGYAWDGPSGPTIDTPDFMRGSLVHDGLYQLMREGLISRKHRAYADRLLRDICREDGMPWWRAQYVYVAVRLFAASAAK